MSTTAATLLICTVGSPEPVVAALKEWRPLSIQFIHTPATKGKVVDEILPKAREEGIEIDHGRYELFELPDGQDLTSCLDRLRLLTPKVSAWAARGADCRVVVDFTGGTKCMTAALAIHATRWPCVFSYVGGRERTRDGVGTVVSGSEAVHFSANPWDGLGHQAVDEYVVLFDQQSFLAAANLASMTKMRVTQPDRKREFACLEQLAKALDAWDRFDHKASKAALDNVAKAANDLRAVFGVVRGDRIVDSVNRLAVHLDDICQATPPSRHHVLDLLANASRRKGEGRIDDAVARLYRATEAIAQVALQERHQIESTEKVLLDRIPEPLRSERRSRATENVIALGLQEAYALLAGLGDPSGAKFQSLGLSGEKSPLSARNKSILAHGFERVSDAVFNRLWTATLSLAEVDAASFPSFPALAAPTGRT